MTRELIEKRVLGRLVDPLPLDEQAHQAATEHQKQRGEVQRRRKYGLVEELVDERVALELPDLVRVRLNLRVLVALIEETIFVDFVEVKSI